jgi:hypothetical protein
MTTMSMAMKDWQSAFTTATIVTANTISCRRTYLEIATNASLFDDGVVASRTMTGRLNYIWTCMMKNSKGSSAVAEENSQGEQQQPRRFVRQWSTTKINYSMGAVSAAAKPLWNLLVGCERNSKLQGVCTIAPSLLKPPTLNGLPNFLGCQRHVTRP